MPNRETISSTTSSGESFRSASSIEASSSKSFFKVEAAAEQEAGETELPRAQAEGEGLYSSPSLA
jgi:hypothetical protein